MNRRQKLKEFNIILLLVFLLSCFLFILSYMVLRDLPVLLSLLYDYVDSGNSFFIPIIPNINILWFLPEKYRIIKLSIGQLIDFMIIANLYSYIDTIIYHYIKKTCLNEDLQKSIYIDSYSIKSNVNFYVLSQNPALAHRLKEESRYLDEKGINIDRNSSLGKRSVNIFGNLHKKDYENINIQNRLLHKKHKFRFNNRYKDPNLSYYHPFSETFCDSPSINHYNPKVYNITDFNKSFQRVGGLI